MKLFILLLIVIVVAMALSEAWNTLRIPCMSIVQVKDDIICEVDTHAPSFDQVPRKFILTH